MALSNGESFTGEDVALLERHRIDYTSERPVRVVHQDGQLMSVDLGAAGMVAADALFFNTGQQPHCALPQMLGCEAQDNREVRPEKSQSLPAGGDEPLDEARNLHGVSIVGGGEFIPQ